MSKTGESRFESDDRGAPDSSGEVQDGAGLDLLKATLAEPVAPTWDVIERLLLGHSMRMGPPQIPTPTGKAGKPPTKTQYDLAHDFREWLRGSFRRFAHQKIELPKLGKSGSWLQSRAYVQTVLDVLLDPRIERHKRVSEVIDRLAIAGLPQPSKRTVQDHIKLNLAEIESHLRETHS